MPSTKNSEKSNRDKKRCDLEQGKVRWQYALLDQVLSVIRRYNSEHVTSISSYNPFLICLTILIFHFPDSLFRLNYVISKKIVFKILPRLNKIKQVFIVIYNEIYLTNCFSFMGITFIEYE